MGENNQKTRLDSWKEIADYLGRDVRTVIRWEKDKALPVHRVPGGKHHSVFAYREEIDVWLASGSAPANGAVPEAPRRPAWVWAVAVASVLLVGGGFAAVRYNSQREPMQVERVTFRGSEIVAWDSRGKEAWTYRVEPPLVMGDPVSPSTC